LFLGVLLLARFSSDTYQSNAQVTKPSGVLCTFISIGEVLVMRSTGLFTHGYYVLTATRWSTQNICPIGFFFGTVSLHFKCRL
jgi:uncharacterized membrane protein YiaA